MTDNETSAIDNIGPHLLGRKRPTAEQIAGDWSLETILRDSALDVAFAKVQAATSINPAAKAWIVAAQPLIKSLAPTPGPTPTPTPTPAPTPAPDGSVLYPDSDSILDQGQTGHCVGFGSAQWGNTLPVDDHFTNDDGHKLYYACKVKDGEPGAEDGSTVHSAASVLKAQGRLSAYAWATTTDAITAYLKSHGPVVVGTDWMNDMFTPDANGYLHPTGGVAGGHCFVLVGWGVDAQGREFYVMRNSWGASWGSNGTAKILVSDFAKLLASQGEALAAVELPVA